MIVTATRDRQAAALANPTWAGGAMRAAIIDDHVLFAEVLGTWLEERLPGFVNVYCGPDPHSALRSAPDLVLLDVELGKGSPEAATVVSWFADKGILVIIMHEADCAPRLRGALLAGAAGSVAKSCHPDHLVRTITDAMSGHETLTRELAEIMCSPGPPRLSPQELRALRLYAAGLPLKSVARQMGVGTSTAKEYLDRVRAKYDAIGRTARTRTELTNVARSDGLVD